MAPLSLGALLESLFRTFHPFLPFAGAKELWGRCPGVEQVSTSEASFPWEGLWELCSSLLHFLSCLSDCSGRWICTLHGVTPHVPVNKAFGSRR